MINHRSKRRDFDIIQTMAGNSGEENKNESYTWKNIIACIISKMGAVVCGYVI